MNSPKILGSSESAVLLLLPTIAFGQMNVSISPFPYALTPVAVQEVNNFIKTNANLYTVQLDNGIPWQEALTGAPFDADILSQWQTALNDKTGNNQPVYIAIEPLAEDRMSWAPGFNGAAAPSWAVDATENLGAIETAYTNYVLRVVAYFKPKFLNIGVECGDLASNDPTKWPQFEQLFTQCVGAVRAAYPSTKIGISNELPYMMEPGVLPLLQRTIINGSDYIGISFYPFMSQFYAANGAATLPAPPNQWRTPLNWLATNATKPIAICETGYSSTNVSLPSYNLNMIGSSTLQSDYVFDLAAYAKFSNYSFTSWFLSVDYDALHLTGGSNLWVHTGFFDKNLKAKPAWAIYQSQWR